MKKNDHTSKLDEALKKFHTDWGGNKSASEIAEELRLGRVNTRCTMSLSNDEENTSAAKLARTIIRAKKECENAPSMTVEDALQFIQTT